MLYLIRHGQSEVNTNPDLIGQDATTQLTELGKNQAVALRDHFENRKLFFDAHYSSDYTRALDTAKIVAKPNPIILHSALREYSAGDWKHGSRKEILTPAIQLKMASLNNTFQPPHGEALNQVERRVSLWLEETILYNDKVIEMSKRPEPPKFAVFSHGMTIKCLLHYVLGFDKSMTWKIDIDNTSVTTLSFNLRGEVGWRLHGVNDTSHLK